VQLPGIFILSLSIRLPRASRLLIQVDSHMTPNPFIETSIQLPYGLLSHPLFRGGARFVDPPVPLIAAMLDVRIRRIRNMPSASDDSEDAARFGVDRVRRMALQWLDAKPCRELESCRELLQRISQIRDGLNTDILPDLLKRMMTMLARRLPPELVSYVPTGTEKIDAIRKSLDLLSLLLLDHGMSHDGAVGRRYLKKLYCAVDDALHFNATTDDIRGGPVLRWIRERLEVERRTDCSYVDVGCAMVQGAPATIRASRLLRPGRVCTQIHGADIVPPSREFAINMLREHRVCLYHAEPVRRPLPRGYDVILLANVHRHLDRKSQEQMLMNLGKSMNENGQLFVNWRFDSTNSPCICLKKQGDQLLLAEEGNFPK